MEKKREQKRSPPALCLSFLSRTNKQATRAYNIYQMVQITCGHGIGRGTLQYEMNTGIQGSLMRGQSSGESMKIFPQKWVRSLSEKIGTLSIEGGL